MRRRCSASSSARAVCTTHALLVRHYSNSKRTPIPVHGKAPIARTRNARPHASPSRRRRRHRKAAAAAAATRQDAQPDTAHAHSQCASRAAQAPLFNPQSQSFFRGYGSILPTSLTYVILSTRGYTPWRPDAVMSTSMGANNSLPRIFMDERMRTRHFKK